jgi:transcriptional regulator with XRE-family HTH domain
MDNPAQIERRKTAKPIRRRLADIPQYLIADEFGVDTGAIARIERIERGDANPNDAELVRILVKMLQVPMDDAHSGDVPVRVMLALAFRPEWAADYVPIPLKTMRAYFKGTPIKPMHAAMMTECAWQVVQAAQALLLQTSLDDPALIDDPRWLTFSRRVYDCGCMLKEANDEV